METELKEGIIILHPQGSELGAEVAEVFKTEGLAAIPEGGGRVAVDLSPIDFMDSSGLSALVALTKRARGRGGLVLFGVQPAVHEIFRLTRLDSVFPVRGSLETAIEYFQEGEQRAAGGQG